jgi:dienelactone hydrolase
MRTIPAAIILTIAFAAIPARAAEWTSGTFQANGKPVQEFHCAPSGAGPFPVVIMLHGAGPRGMGNEDMEDFCGKLADQGYYTEFIEYYSQTSDVSPGETAEMTKDFPIWIGEIHAGIGALKDNHAVDSKRVGMMGFSLGAYLSLTYGATYPDDISAIVEFYGGLMPELNSKAATMPPVLILHGSGDKIVPVSNAKDLDELLTKANRPHEMKLYPGADHGFNFVSAVMWYNKADADDAWDRSLAFLDKYLKK